MSKNSWIDISVPLCSTMHGWPGNPPTVVTMFNGTAKGDVCNVSAINFNSHTGTHMDAPLHFLHGAKSMDALPWDAVIGEARVVEIKDKKAIKPAELKKLKLKEGERILFKTPNSARSWKKAEFDKDFVYVSKEAAQYIVDCGVQTVGIDYLSVGGFYKDGIETHHILLGAEVWIIEGIDLSKVKPGNYDLICLPIKFQNGDGAPSRCLIRPR
ncbi:cyclase family protein [Chthoniobacter flavus Ellin428]|uniref:Kynurenine formamidase n=1 Tax=Chthoniobacter flavus Ellin428 TaxID=497964 RepID=B4CWI4_9BACT|nr:cyclase family protein [Chthoniobacter flavus]EDY21776.1 cyclase family protein [Chthoniobacter flavus Ellin428]TCO95707.1 kynurenine formamidase [Chthoniobacter flavus]